MSKVKIQGNASGTGVVTLTAPNTNTDRTITLPDSTGSILDSTSTLDATKLSGALPAIDGASLTNLPGGGKVLQVVKSSTTTDIQHNVTTITGTNVRATITPSSASSRIMIASYGQLQTHNGCGSNLNDVMMFLYRDGSNVTSTYMFRGYCSGARYPLNISFLDSPNTTSAVEYRIFMGGGDTQWKNYPTHYGEMVLMEIGV